MVYYTGDIHGDISRVISFIENNKLTSEDILVLLGDVGLNYYGDKRIDKMEFLMHSIVT